MKREQLEHIIRAASAITNLPDIVVIGSQSILGQFPDAKTELLSSMEADVYPRNRPDMSIQIDGAIGERSLFHETFGYYAHGVSENVATLPFGWEQRLVPICNANTGIGTGWCLDVYDLAASKLAAGREKDLIFVNILLSEKMITPAALAIRLDMLALSDEKKSLIQSRFKKLQTQDISTPPPV